MAPPLTAADREVQGRRQSTLNSKEGFGLSDQWVRIIVFAVLLLHGLGHGGAIAALLWVRRRPEADTGGWLSAQSWAFPALTVRGATALATAFWALALVGFVAAALAFLGLLGPGEAWRQIAVASALVSTAGIVLFLGRWPAFNTLAALGVNAAVLITQLWMQWPPPTTLVS